MPSILKALSLLGLALTGIPSLLVFQGTIAKPTHFMFMTAGLVLWFGTAPFWMKSASLEDGANS